MEPNTGPDDVSADYMKQKAQSNDNNDVKFMEQFAAGIDVMGDSPTLLDVSPAPSDVPARPLPPPRPVRAQATDDLGSPAGPPERSTAGTIMKNMAEIVPQAVAGVDSAVHNALSFVDPLTNWLNENVADLSYDHDAPTTTTGALTRATAEFLTGFIPAMKGLKALGMTGSITTPMAAGAIADFVVRDPHEGRLADLWDKAGLPKNVLTDYLKSDPSDNEVEARFKNTMEGVIVGTAFDGVLQGARMIRAAKKVKGAQSIEKEALEAKYGAVDDKAFSIIGDPSKPIIETRVRRPHPVGEKIIGAIDEVGDTTDPRALIRLTPRKGKSAAVQSEDFEVYVNFTKIDEPDQVRFVIGKMAEKMKGQIDEARRGVMTEKEMEGLADDVGMTVPELLARRKGQPFNAEQAISARRLWAASGEKLLEAAKKANDKNSGPIDQFNFRKMMAVHAAIQAEVIGARTETARALRSWAIPVSGVERARAIDQLMGAMGGDTTSREMARRLAILAENGAHPSVYGKIAERSFAANSVDALRELFVNGLLSSPKTHVVNITSNSLVAIQSIYERAVAGGIRAGIGGDGTNPAEALAMSYGLIESVKDAWRLAAKSLKTGETGWALNKVDLNSPNALSAEGFKMSKETGMGRFVDFIGTVANVPTRLLGAEDEFFKTIGYRMELRALSLREATREGHKGMDLIKRVNEITNNPPDHIRIGAADAALYNTFTNETGVIGRKIMDLRNVDSPLNPAILVLPFVRTPINIARYAFERSPFAPLVGQWRDDIAAGGARADLALARMSTGTAIMLTAMDFADSGSVSGEGPKDTDIREAMIRQGWQPFSVKVGDRWYSYNRTDPFGMTMGLAASITEAIKGGEIDQNDVDEWHEVVAMAIAAVAQVSISKTYLQGFADLVEVATDPKRYTEGYTKDLIASFTPMVSLNSAVKNMVDPVQRETGTPWEAIQAKIAVLSERLPPRRNLWGEEIRAESGLGRVYDFVSPVASKPQKSEPIDREIVRLQDGPERITKKPMFAGVQVNLKHYPQVYNDYTRLAGNGLKHPTWNMGAKDYLNAVVGGDHAMSPAYKIMSDEGRRAFIRNTIQNYRQLAQQQIMADPKHKMFADEVNLLRSRAQDARMPVLE